MKRNFTNENMEEFLRQNADSLWMRPSAKVWKGISSHLNKRRRRFGLLIGTSLLLTTALGYYLISETANTNKTITTAKPKTESTVAKQFAVTSQKSSNELITSKNNHLKITRNFSAITNKSISNSEDLIALNNQSQQNVFNPTIIDPYLEQQSGVENKTDETNHLSFADTDPLSIESVLNIYNPKKRKLSWQTYFTPTVSYRKLNDNNIDNVAPHKPAFGFQLGVAAKYPVSKIARLRAGLQFNVNRYEIKTYDSYYQYATIRLNDRNGVDYVRTVTSYNNYSGYKSSWLQNFYFQVSAPVGVEVKVKGDDKVQFGVASTVQPTYLLGDKTYLISSDYKNYAEMQGLVRRWNINSSLETYVAYSTGHLSWQVGPQVRYQILSSYLKKYPVKENLFDFGLKVGISFNKQ